MHNNVSDFVSQYTHKHGICIDTVHNYVNQKDQVKVSGVSTKYTLFAVMKVNPTINETGLI